MFVEVFKVNSIEIVYFLYSSVLKRAGGRLAKI